jgi:hypothetical protein
MLARKVAIFRDKYLEIGHSKGEWNLEIDQIRVMVCREFPTSASKRALRGVFAGQKAFSGGRKAGTEGLGSEGLGTMGLSTSGI